MGETGRNATNNHEKTSKIKHVPKHESILTPTFAFSSSASGGVDAVVATVGHNVGSFDETVLAPGPWSITAPKTAIGAQYSSLAQCTGAGDSTFSAHGLPDDAAMFQANRRHEDHHATDHETAFNSTILNWDIALMDAQANATNSVSTLCLQQITGHGDKLNILIAECLWPDNGQSSSTF